MTDDVFAMFDEDRTEPVIRAVPEDVNELAYDWADSFSDWYGCDSARRERLTGAFEQAVMEDRANRSLVARLRRLFF